MFGKTILILHASLLISLTLENNLFESSEQVKERPNFECAYKQHKKESLKNFEESYHCKNNFEQCGIVKKIDYHPCSHSSRACIINVNLNSACIRCEICLSIVDQINHTLIFLHDQIHPILHLNESQVESIFKIICGDSFKNYGLKDVDGRRIISDRIPEANLVATNIDGQWGDHLKKRCYELTGVIGTIKLYNHWKDWWNNGDIDNNMPKLDLFLCRDESTFFRDCKSIPCSNRHVLRFFGNEQLRKKICDII